MERIRVSILAATMCMFGFLPFTAGGGICRGAPGPRLEDPQQQRPPKEEIYEFPRQEVALEDFAAKGFILAIGGGGEGIIGQLKGEQVVAVDLIERELKDAPPGPLKIVMDARDLKFLDGSFQTAASFFTLMYIQGSDQPKVFEQVYRVLKPGGRFLIWDLIFPEKPDPRKKYGLVRLDIKLPSKTVETGYGVLWPDKPHDAAYYEELGRAAGFEVGAARNTGQWFYLELKKP